jgi:transcriptional regulator with XRE-family HTH domain
MVDRITLLLKTRNISASQFADEIGVQRSSISHVLSGRNKPSLDFIQKILVRYPEINPDWLLFGKGSMNLEYNLFSELTDPVPLKPEALSKAISRHERPIRAVPDENWSQPLPQDPEEEKNMIQDEVIVPEVKPVQEKLQTPVLEVKSIENIVNQQVEQIYVPPVIQSAPESLIPPVSMAQSVASTPNEPVTQPQSIPSPQPQQQAYTGSATMAALAPLVEKEVEQITIFYKDRTFILYKPS